MRVKGTVWSIEKLRAAPMPSMVVTGVPLKLSDVEVKDRVIVGSKEGLLAEHRGELERLLCAICSRARASPPPLVG